MSKYLTVKQMADRHPAFSESSLRYHIFNEHTNGFSKVIIRVGRKVLLNEEAFLGWIEENAESVPILINGAA